MAGPTWRSRLANPLSHRLQCAPGTLTVLINQLARSAPATHLQVNSSTSTVVPGLPFFLTVSAVSAANQVDMNFIDPVMFSGGGPGAALPPSTNFVFSNHGIQTFGGIILNTPGPQTLTVTDSANGSIVGTITLTVGTVELAVAPTITSAATATFLVGTAGVTRITAVGSPTPALSVMGVLPAGMEFVDTDNGLALLSGTPTVTGTFTFTITAANGVAPNATQTFTLKVNELDSIVGRDLQNGQWWTGVSNGSSTFTNTYADAWSPAVTWVDVLTGDFNGDGFTDFAGRVLQSGQWWVALSDGKGHFTTSLWDAWSPGIAWTDVRAADFNSDGKTDLAGRDPGTGIWYVDISTGSAFLPATPWTTWATSVTWVDVLAGDLTGNGKADLVGRVQQTGQWWAALSTGSSFTNSLWTTWYAGVTWVDVQLGDFNGDGKQDLVGRVQESGQWWVGLSTGISFQNSLWDTWSTGVTWVDVKVGDLNGDGKADLIGRALESGQWWAAVSTGASFANGLWAQWSPSVTWVDVQLGDFNGDGKLDVAGMVQQTGQWWVGLSTGTSLQTSLWGRWYPGVTWVDVHEGAFA